MCCIVLCAADFPVPCVHGLLAVRSVLLRVEVDLVLRDLHQILLTRCDQQLDLLEALACIQLFAGERRGAQVLAYHVDAGAIRVGGSCYAVRRQQCIGVRTVRLSGFRTCTQKGPKRSRYLLPIELLP